MSNTPAVTDALERLLHNLRMIESYQKATTKMISEIYPENPPKMYTDIRRAQIQSQEWIDKIHKEINQ